MKRALKVLFTCIMCLSLVGCGGSASKTNEEVEKILEEAGTISEVFKYEFGSAPYAAVIFEDYSCYFKLGKENIDEEYYDLDLSKNGGITYVLGSDTNPGYYSISKDSVAQDGEENSTTKEVQEELGKMLKELDITQEELFNYVVDYASNNLLKETVDDKKTYLELLKENNYGYYVEDKSFMITDGDDYYMYVKMTDSESSVKTGYVSSGLYKNIMFGLPHTTTLGTNVFLQSTTNVFYDLDNESVVSGSGTVSFADISVAEDFQKKCYEMLENLHITTIIELRDLYNEIK